MEAAINALVGAFDVVSLVAIEREIGATHSQALGLYCEINGLEQRVRGRLRF
jgi:hypothetical protein